MHQFNSSNPEFLTFKYEQLLFSIMGGIRLDGLDRMRATLKIEFRSEAIRHNLDLYNDTQCEKLIRKTAERLGVGVSYMQKAVMELISELENYRLEENQRKSTLSDKKVHVLTEAERKEAEQFLKSSDLLQRTNDMIGKSGVVGEDLNRILMYLIFTSRKMQRPLHIVSFGSSGAGKSHLQEKVSELIPQEDKIEITSLTGNAFYYFDENELGHKLILIEDLDGVLAALYPIRELQSKQKISKTVTVKDKNGNAKTISLTVHGPVSIAGCTTQERIYEDNANRSFLIQVDESQLQDERIMDYQRALSANKIDVQAQLQTVELLQNVQRVLQPIRVVNPYAELLKIPREVFKPRRTNAHYIAFIEVITFYHQMQRKQKVDEVTGELYIETTLEDIQEANRLIKYILLRKSDELSGACRSYFEALKKYLKANKLQSFTNKEIRAVLRTNHNTQKMFMTDLQRYGYVQKIEGDKKKGFHYTVTSFEEYEELQQRISTVLDEVLEVVKLKEVVGREQPLKSLSKKGSQRKSEVVVQK